MKVASGRFFERCAKYRSRAANATSDRLVPQIKLTHALGITPLLHQSTQRVAHAVGILEVGDAHQRRGGVGGAEFDVADADQALPERLFEAGVLDAVQLEIVG